MEADFIVVSGPLLGACYPLGEDELSIGRAPSCDIRLSDSGTAWEHCIVRPRDGRHYILDRHTGTGTYVNGMRVSEHCFEPGDQVSIGETVLVYREDAAAQSGSAQHSLLHACALVFLFRALAVSRSAPHRAALEGQLLKLIGDVAPSSGGAVLFGRDEDELRAAAGERTLDIEQLIKQALAEGSAIDCTRRTVALALHVRGRVAGVLAVSFPEQAAPDLENHRETLSAVATLAAAALETVEDIERLQTENATLLDRIGAGECGMVGDSTALIRLRAMIARVAPQETSVLVLGESGTGKELVARAVHRQSPRTARPFMAINCAALTETLLESELFGHEKGAFTGAVAQKKGKLEAAEGGTVFLDEIGELAPQLQAKLLRVLQQREFERVGSTRTLRLDVRIVAATNRDLAAEVRRNAFREDLYHRLNVVALRVPPLRERAEDIAALSRYFLERAAAQCRRRVRGISPEAERYLRQYSWPGNVRELENAIERAVVLGESDMIMPEDLPETVLETAALPEVPGALQTALIDTKRQRILAAWREAAGDHNRAAELLHLHPNSLRRLLRVLNLREIL